MMKEEPITIIEDIKAGILSLKEDNKALQKQVEILKHSHQGSQHQKDFQEITEKYQATLKQKEALENEKNDLIADLKQLKEALKARPPATEAALHSAGKEASREEVSNLTPPSKETTDTRKYTEGEPTIPTEGADTEEPSTDASPSSSTASSKTDDHALNESSPFSSQQKSTLDLDDDPFDNENTMMEDDDFFKSISDKES